MYSSLVAQVEGTKWFLCMIMILTKLQVRERLWHHPVMRKCRVEYKSAKTSGLLWMGPMGAVRINCISRKYIIRIIHKLFFFFLIFSVLYCIFYFNFISFLNFYFILFINLYYYYFTFYGSGETRQM